jgi:predicted DNA-binding transcriptional regulator YafY
MKSKRVPSLPKAHVGSVNPWAHTTIHRALARGIEERRLIEFAYTGVEDTHQWKRQIEPVAVVHFVDRTYLHGFDLDRDDWRTFRLDRLSNLRVTGTAFTPRAHHEPVLLVNRSITRGPEGIPVSIVVPTDNPVAFDPRPLSHVWRREKAGSPSGWLRIVFLTSTNATGIAALTQAGDQWILESPDELLADLRRLATNFLRTDPPRGSVID